MKKIVATLLYLIDDDKILLAKNKYGFGKGKYNGVGGKVEQGESIEDAMIRECQEEIGVTPIRYNRLGSVTAKEMFCGEYVELTFYVFVASIWEGTPKEYKEVIPKWFSLRDIPYSNMFESDRYWLPLVLNGDSIEAFFEFDEEWTILSKKVQIV